MKSVLLTTAFLLSLSFVASANPSLDRTTLDQTIQRAQQEKKSVILEVAAAWCGPCTEFAYDLHEHPESLKALSEAGYLFAKVEYEKVSGDNINRTDFLPKTIFFFPSFYLYSNGQWKSLGTYGSTSTLLQVLKQTAGQQLSLSITEVKAYLEALEKSNGASSDSLLSTRFGISTMAVSDYYSYADAKTIINLLRTEELRFPSLGLGDTASMIETYGLQVYLGRSDVSLADLQKDFPAVVANMIDVSQDNFDNSIFKRKLENLVRSSGIKAAFNQCAAISQEVRAKLIPGTLSGADLEKKMKQVDKDFALACANLELRANGPSEALKQKVAQLGKISDWTIISGLGEISDAIKIYHDRYVNFLNGYNSSLKSAQDSLAEAQKSGNQDQIKQLTHSIEVTKFQIRNHADVDADVESALQSHREIQLLKVMN